MGRLTGLMIVCFLACARPVPTPPELRRLGSGVTLTVAPVERQTPGRPPANVGLLGFRVTLRNDGKTPLDVRYRDFALLEPGPARSPALLPAELNDVCAPSALLPEGTLPSGGSVSGLLYFRRQPSASPAPLEIVLESAGDIPISTNLIAVRLSACGSCAASRSAAP